MFTTGIEPVTCDLLVAALPLSYENIKTVVGGFGWLPCEGLLTATESHQLPCVYRKYTLYIMLYSMSYKTGPNQT